MTGTVVFILVGLSAFMANVLKVQCTQRTLYSWFCSIKILCTHGRPTVYSRYSVHMVLFIQGSVYSMYCILSYYLLKALCVHGTVPSRLAGLRKMNTVG